MKVLVVDDHPLFRQGLTGIARQLDEAATVLECASYTEAQQLLDDDLDLLLLDLRLPDVDGLQALALLRADYPALPVVVVSASENKAEVLHALRLGALGFVPKSASPSVLENALRLVLAGDVYLPSHILLAPDALAAVTPSAVEPPRNTFGLTERQLEVKDRMAEGKSNKQIARELNISENTVKVHITAILKALGVSTRAEAIAALGRRTDGLSPPRFS